MVIVWPYCPISGTPFCSIDEANWVRCARLGFRRGVRERPLREASSCQFLVDRRIRQPPRRPGRREWKSTEAWRPILGFFDRIGYRCRWSRFRCEDRRGRLAWFEHGAVRGDRHEICALAAFRAASAKCVTASAVDSNSPSGASNPTPSGEISRL